MIPSFLPHNPDMTSAPSALHDIDRGHTTGYRDNPLNAYGEALELAGYRVKHYTNSGNDFIPRYRLIAYRKDTLFWLIRGVVVLEAHVTMYGKIEVRKWVEYG